MGISVICNAETDDSTGGLVVAASSGGCLLVVVDTVSLSWTLVIVAAARWKDNKCARGVSKHDTDDEWWSVVSLVQCGVMNVRRSHNRTCSSM